MMFIVHFSNPATAQSNLTFRGQKDQSEHSTLDEAQRWLWNTRGTRAITHDGWRLDSCSSIEGERR